MDETYFVGEQIRINKRKKFEYSVFSSYPGIFMKSAEQTIVKGKYKITNDTLNLYAVTKPPWGAEMFNLKSRYLIRAIEISNTIGRSRIITCLIDPEKLESFEHFLLQLPSTLENFYAKANDVLLVKHLNEIGLEAEIFFYQKSIFIKD